MNGILDASPKDCLEFYLSLVRDVVEDIDFVREEAMATALYFKGSGAQTETGKTTEARWYASLKTGKPDWSVYEGDYYVAEVWGCWLAYSRVYLRSFRDSNRVGKLSVVESIGDVDTIMDLGCGTGLTTLALSQLFPNARVIGTNLEDTSQISVARKLAEANGFEIETSPSVPADVVFASEYFEHVTSPIRHLREVLREVEPEVLLVANAFTARSVGHFPHYTVGRRVASGKKTSAAFASALRQKGFSKVNTRLWNQRPAYWSSRNPSTQGANK